LDLSLLTVVTQKIWMVRLDGTLSTPLGILSTGALVSWDAVCTSVVVPASPAFLLLDGYGQQDTDTMHRFPHGPQKWTFNFIERAIKMQLSGKRSGIAAKHVRVF
jgi:hypothetical protein